MIVENRTLWDGATYDLYLQGNSMEIQGDRRHPAIILCAGGGFLRVSDREKEPVALCLLAHGYQVVVLNYGTCATGAGRYPKPLLDLARMIASVRDHAEEWNIASDKIAIMGFSSGGTLCASLATCWQEPFLSDLVHVPAEKLRPNAVVLCYPMLDFLQERASMEKESEDRYSPCVGMRRNAYLKISYEAMLGSYATEEQYRQTSPYYHVTSQVPPTFLWHTAQDEMVSAAQSMRYALRLQEEGVPYELHIFEEGAHGLALAGAETSGVPELINRDVAEWIGMAVRFLKRHL
jgi:acetyl esterase/lipase